MTCAKMDRCEHGEYCQKHIGSSIIACSFFEQKVPMTNEEWFCTLSTEEKAKWLSRNSKFMYGCGRMETTPKIMYEEDWECWLKEIHE